MFWDRFNRLCESVGKKPNPVGKEIGVSSGLITKWKNGTLPKVEHLILISKYFNVTPDYLLGFTDLPSEYAESLLQNNEFSVEEKNLILSFRKLNDSGKGKLLGYMDALLDSDEHEFSPKEITG